MTAERLEQELAVAIQEFQVSVLLAVRAGIDAVLATYQTTPAPAPVEGPPVPAPPPPAHTAALRDRIVEIVRARPRVSANAIARAMSMHVGTLRPYLAMLLADGRLRTEPGRPEAPGRPAFVYFVAAPSVAAEPGDPVAVEAAPDPASQEVQP